MKETHDRDECDDKSHGESKEEARGEFEGEVAHSHWEVEDEKADSHNSDAFVLEALDPDQEPEDPTTRRGVKEGQTSQTKSDTKDEDDEEEFGQHFLPLYFSQEVSHDFQIVPDSIFDPLGH